jgi:hypothetical protein
MVIVGCAACVIATLLLADIFDEVMDRSVDPMHPAPPDGCEPDALSAFFGNPPSAEHAQPSAADIHKETEVLRALKEQLDAQVEAAQATIRRARGGLDEEKG